MLINEKEKKTDDDDYDFNMVHVPKFHRGMEVTINGHTDGAVYKICDVRGKCTSPPRYRLQIPSENITSYQTYLESQLTEVSKFKLGDKFVVDAIEPNYFIVAEVISSTSGFYYLGTPLGPHEEGIFQEKNMMYATKFKPDDKCVWNSTKVTIVCAHKDDTYSVYKGDVINKNVHFYAPENELKLYEPPLKEGDNLYFSIVKHKKNPEDPKTWQRVLINDVKVLPNWDLSYWYIPENGNTPISATYSEDEVIKNLRTEEEYEKIKTDWETATIELFRTDVIVYNSIRFRKANSAGDLDKNIPNDQYIIIMGTKQFIREDYKKVEPKFKVGDKVVSPVSGNKYTIVSFNNVDNTYRCNATHHNKIVTILQSYLKLYEPPITVGSTIMVESDHENWTKYTIKSVGVYNDWGISCVTTYEKVFIFINEADLIKRTMSLEDFIKFETTKKFEKFIVGNEYYLGDGHPKNWKLATITEVHPSEGIIKFGETATNGLDNIKTPEEFAAYTVEYFDKEL
jgi:hypothetical protein